MCPPEFFLLLYFLLLCQDQYLVELVEVKGSTVELISVLLEEIDIKTAQVAEVGISHFLFCSTELFDFRVLD